MEPVEFCKLSVTKGPRGLGCVQGATLTSEGRFYAGKEAGEDRGGAVRR